MRKSHCENAPRFRKNSALFIIGQWEDTFHKSQHKTQVFLRKEKLEIRKTIKLRVWSQRIWNHFKHFTGRVRCANVQYCQETGGIFPTVCNYSMCVHALKIFAHYFQERISNTKRYVGSSSIVLSSDQSILKIDSIHLIKIEPFT